MNDIEDIKSGDIIYSPKESWLLFCTSDMCLVWLSISTSVEEDDIACGLNSFRMDVDTTTGRIKTKDHLTGIPFYIIGNIKELVEITDKEIKLDRD